jgi:DNA-binding transcriptional LysR family regulator
LDFAWMTTFVAVARTGSMTAAAAELGISQPGVSRQIQRLEEEIGIPLVDRGSRMLLSGLCRHGSRPT